MNIKKLFNMQSDQEKIVEYRNLLKKSFEITKEINELSTLFAEKSSIAKSFSSMDQEEREDAEKRYNEFLDEHAKNVAVLQRKREQVFKSLSKLSKDTELQEVFSDMYDIYSAKENVKRGMISKQIYNDIIKAKTKVVRYADVLLFRGDKLLILQRAGEYGASTSQWCIPGGHVDPGESFLEAAARELFEETGIEIPEDLLIEAGVAKGKDYEIHYFLGHVDDESPIQIIVDSEEEVGSTWIDIRTELDDYDFIFDMKENIKKILGRECPEGPIQIITKAFARGEINEKIFEDFCKKHKEEIEKEVNKPELSCIAKSYIPEKEREKLEKEGKAMAGGRFPVRNVSDLRNAIKLVGNSDLPKSDVITYLKRRAKDLGATDELPESWNEVEKTIDCNDVNTICKESLDKEIKEPSGDGIAKAEGFNILINFNDLDEAEMFKSLVDELKNSGKLDIASIETKNEEIEKSWGIDEIKEETYQDPSLDDGVLKAKDTMYKVFVDYANFLEGVKTRSKNVHWKEEDNSKHIYLDDLIEELSEYEDKIMEAGQSEFGRFEDGSVNGEEININDPIELVDLIIERTKTFYDKIGDNTDYVGEKSWTEDFLATLKQTKYRLQLH
jgi:8-oxo-dGTP pyrophosphatase MutT (NUDIX family)